MVAACRLVTRLVRARSSLWEDKAEQHLDGCQCRANGIGSEKQHVADRKGIDGEKGAVDAVDEHGGKVDGRRGFCGQHRADGGERSAVVGSGRSKDSKHMGVR